MRSLLRFFRLFDARMRAGLSLVAVLLIAQVGLQAQTGGGTIQGVVKDSSDAVIVGARIVATNAETLVKSETRSNEIGFYVLPGLRPGPYRVAVESPGMEEWQGEMRLQVGQTAVVDPVMRTGTTTERITVVGNVTPLVTSESPTLGNVVERARIEQLPLNGRLMQSLIPATTPGVEGSGVPLNTGSASVSASNPTVYGIRFGMQFLQDGAVLANRTWGGIVNRPPGMDTVEEMRVETNTSSAKFSSPATTVLSTRSGTNTFHGSAFETARNNGLGVARARQDFYSKPPQLIRNEFGVSGGGPVFLPKIYNGRNRTFFFFGWEAFRNAYSATAVTSVHTMAMRQGDFGGLVDGAGRRYTLYDPWSTDASSSMQA
jgi:hypothetical protein